MNKLTFVFSLSLGVSFGVLSLLAPKSFAQSTNLDTFEYSANEYDTLNGNRSFNPLDMIHRANLQNGVSQEEFYQNSGAGIQDAAAEFKRQRQQLLEQQNNSTTPDSTVNQ